MTYGRAGPLGRQIDAGRDQPSGRAPRLRRDVRSVLRLLDQARVDQRAEAVGHHLLDDLFERLALLDAVVDELNPHAGLVPGRDLGRQRGTVLHHPAHLPAQRERRGLRRQHQLEQEYRADVERFLGLDEGATLRDVLRVIVEERVQSLVLDLELDRGACFSASLVVVGHGGQGEGLFMLEPVRAAVNEARRGTGLRALVWAGLLAILAVVLAFIPLFDVLGYDFSFALGLAAAVAAVDVGHGLVAVRGRPADAPGLLRLCARACVVAAALLVLPLLISVANALRVRNCSFAVGFGFFALLPLATVVYAAPAGVLVGTAVHGRRR